MSDNHDELCCAYAALILADDKSDASKITADRLNAIIEASGNRVESYWPTLFAKYLANLDLDDLITNVGSASAAPAAGGAAGGSGGGAAEEKVEEKEPTEESDDDMGFSLFD